MPNGSPDLELSLATRTGLTIIEHRFLFEAAAGFEVAAGQRSLADLLKDGKSGETRRHSVCPVI